jgi:eukaryotic-like serine/threonine-protein kinase
MRDPLGLVGTTIDRRYSVRRFVAEGGFGIVYEAEALALGVKVAIKVLRSEILASNPEARTRFEQEARVLAKLRHPGIVAITDASHLDDGTPYLALEWIDGETLDAFINRIGPLPLEDALAMLGPIARAVAHAHEQQIIHRDLKPSNVMIETKTRQARVLDFGLARWASPQGIRTSTDSGTGLSIGFAAPEQYGKEFGPVDARADQFALAAVLYAALTAKPPFAGETLTEVMWATCMSPTRPSLVSDRPELPAAIDTVLQRALSIRSEARYASILDFWRALEDAARGASDVAPPTFKQGPPTNTAGTIPQAATLPSPDVAGPRTDVLHPMMVAATQPAPMTGPAGTKPTGHSPPPSIPPSTAPSTRASPATRWTIVIAIGAAIGAGVFAAWPLVAPAQPPKPPKNNGTQPSTSASTSAVQNGPCGPIADTEACIVGAKLHRGPPDCSKDDPAHRAACPREYVDVATFVMDRYEVSYERYAKCTKCPKKEGDAQLPVTLIKWADAEKFCAHEKKRLPTDAEWELAAAGPHGRTFPWGNEKATAARAVFNAAGPAVIDSLPMGATAENVFHLGGNVAEWTWSTASPDKIPADATGPHAWVRGGSFKSDFDALWTWAREPYSVDLESPTIGFRCARTPKK